MKPRCDKKAPSCLFCPDSGKTRRNGTFFRISDSKIIQRWRCSRCEKSFSQATDQACFNQNKRRVNEPLRKLLCSGVSQRRAAIILNIHKTTVARKLKFLAVEARKTQAKLLEEFKKEKVNYVQFDEMETHEHSKLKPLSIALAVKPDTRKILGVSVCVMPARGPEALKSRLKYGPRKDDRRISMLHVLRGLKDISAENLLLRSDMKSPYPFWIKEVSPVWRHETVKGRRGCVVGQGELKKIGFDPIFSLNHTCAMFRANVNRLFRRTWNTTKKMSCLQDHLDLYTEFHNTELTS